MMNKNNDGFTLIEMVVAMTLFVAVIVTVMSIFLRSVQTERGVAGQSATIANVSLAVEEIAREMRTASNFEVPQGGTYIPLSSFTDCQTPYPSIKFTYTDGFGATTTVSYSRQMNSTTNNNQIMQTINSGQSLPMTPAGTNITNLQFIVTNWCGVRSFPPRITIAVQGTNPANEAFGFVAPFNLETTVSQRLYYYQ
jgi:type II secretory pathway pseudopilin PulG